ncbi:MAG TPA: hypothetical protein VG692_08715 [Gemmatimonadales bacterium]|nr:hypothetical protein [Gemmatimonadales bacterium]
MFSSPAPGRRLVLGALVPGLVLGALAACNTRDRPSFPTGNGSGDSVGPVTSIDAPDRDTTVPAGPAVFVNGRVIDDSGLDTVYVETEGGITTFAPFVRPPSPFRFGLPITTNGLSGAVITVRVFGTDRDGNRGDTASRVITVQ